MRSGSLAISDAVKVMPKIVAMIAATGLRDLLMVFLSLVEVFLPGGTVKATSMPMQLQRQISVLLEG